MLGPFEPTWRRALLAFAIAGAAFLLPQEAPLVWYPLNHPSDVTYLEITCQASAEGETRISLDTGRGFNDLQMIRIPIAPSSQPYTYTFPLWDAPLKGLMLEPLNRPGSLLVTNMRIYTRSGREIKRFTGDDFDATHEIARIAPAAKGWEFVTTPDAHRPYSLCGFFPPIIPDGMNTRNLQRCLLSGSYLALMLWILILAVYFVVRRPPTGGRRPEAGDRTVEEQGAGGREQGDARPESEDRNAEAQGARGKEEDGGAVGTAEARSSLQPPVSPLRLRVLVREAACLAGVALLFAAVGNRGLIKDSIRYTRFPVEPVPPGLRLEFDLAADPPRPARLSWDTGRGFSDAATEERRYDQHPLYQTLRFDLPDLAALRQHLRALRFEPCAAAGTVRIFGVRVVDQGRRTRLRLPVDCLQPERDSATLEVQDSEVLVHTAPCARAPVLSFTTAATGAIDRMLSGADDKEDGTAAD